MKYKELSSPSAIGSLPLKNRMVVTAMGANLAEPDGSWGERVLAYHEAQARGGAAMIISGACGVMYPVGQVQEWQLGLSTDEHIPGLQRAVEAVHRHGAALAVQLHQGGLNAVDDTAAGRPQWCPSEPLEKDYGDFVDGLLMEEIEVLAKAGMPKYRVMSKDDIKTLVQAFADGARRAKTAGCDAVEVHGGHGYVPSSFMSPSTNRRDDEYGGSLENRARLLLEIVAAVRAAVGQDYPVIVKIDVQEVGKTDGITIADAVQVAQWLEQAGADAITASAYHNFAQGKLHSGSNIPHEPNTNLPLAQAVKQAVGIPVIASGRVEPEHADREIAAGKFDFLAMGRKVLADPEFPNKILQGREDEIRPCIYCYTCVSAIYNRQRLCCAVNPECGQEFIAPAARASVHKTVAVIGGGPGGMEAARRLALAGHRVVLFEKSTRLGGTLRFAALAYAANEALLDWLQRQVAQLDIDVRLDTAATAEALRTLQPDHVIVATGARRNLPDIAGAQLPHVFSGDDMRELVLGGSNERLREKTSVMTRLATRVGAATGVTANLALVRKATHAWMPLGKQIVIIGGELVGLELAEFLAHRGRQVTVVDESPRMGAGLQLVRRLRLLAELREQGVALYRGASEVRIESDAVHFCDESGEAREAGAAQVIVAQGACEDRAMANELRSKGFDVFEVGDATGVGYINGAMRDAMEAVAQINQGKAGVAAAG